MGKSETEKLIGVIIEQLFKLSEATEPFYRPMGLQEEADKLRERRKEVQKRLQNKDSLR
jgi:hypothetical protein